MIYGIIGKIGFLTGLAGACLLLAVMPYDVMLAAQVGFPVVAVGIFTYVASDVAGW